MLLYFNMYLLHVMHVAIVCIQVLGIGSKLELYIYYVWLYIHVIFM